MTPSMTPSTTPSTPKPLLFTSALIEVAYTCEKCGTTTKRTIKNNDKKK
jgi:hypothetical protein